MSANKSHIPKSPGDVVSASPGDTENSFIPSSNMSPSAQDLKARKDAALFFKLQETIKIYSLKNPDEIKQAIDELLILGYPEPMIEKVIKEIIKNQNQELPQIELPGNNNLMSEVAKEVADILLQKKTVFYHLEIKDHVEVSKIKLNKQSDEVFTGFSIIKPNRFVTLCEKYMTPYFFKKDTMVYRSFDKNTCDIILRSPIMEEKMPRINKLFTVPLPILNNGELTLPIRGYDERFYSYLPEDAPDIDTNMKLEDAKDILDEVYSEFCFSKPYDKVLAISALLTPFCRGVFDRFSARTPIFFYEGNRERCGKDYCAGITGVLFEGAALEDAPISYGEGQANSSDELRKKILSTFISGRRRLHFANNKGHIDNAILENISTAEKYSDRILGRSENLTFVNDLDISLSGNQGVTFTPDLANRSRFIRLSLAIEDANSRKFKTPNLHQMILDNRFQVLSALYALVRSWHEKGRPSGKIPFASYPEWARVVGGIMEACGYESPCKPDEETLMLSGDRETTEMKRLFELVYKSQNEGEPINQKTIIAMIDASQEELFSYLNLNDQSGRVKFAYIFNKFVGRILSGIKLEIVDRKAWGGRKQYIFTKVQGGDL